MNFRIICKIIQMIWLCLKKITVPSAIRKETKQCSRQLSMYSHYCGVIQFIRFKNNPETNYKTSVNSTESKVGKQRKSCYRSETKGYYGSEQNRPRHFSLISRARKRAAGLRQPERLSCFTAQPFIKSAYFNKALE